MPTEEVFLERQMMSNIDPVKPVSKPPSQPGGLVF
jgi:hypothetical protein